MPTQFPDHALASRIEAAHAHAGVDYAETLARRRPDSLAVAAPFGGGWAAYSGVGSLVSQAAGVGMAGPVVGDEIAGLTAFFHDRGSLAKIECCPLADPSLWIHLTALGYGPAEFENVMVRSLDDLDDGPMPVGLHARRAEPREFDVVSSIVAAGFFEGDEAPPEFREIFATMAEQPSTTAFLGLVDGVPAAGGAVAIHDGVASLAGASTLPRYRNRGAQAALLRTRLAFAASAGCDLAVVCAAPGSGSMRNALRRGFAVGYTRISMQLPTP